PLSRTLREWLDKGFRVVVACHQLPQAERLKELLSPYDIHCSISEATFGEVTGIAPPPSLPPLDHLGPKEGGVNPPPPAREGWGGGRITLLMGDISRGFRLPDSRLALI